MPAYVKNCKNKPRKPHPCPERNFWGPEDAAKLCNCCKECTEECAEDS